jgi:hypothetical protein
LWSSALPAQAGYKSADQALEIQAAVEEQQYCQNDPQTYTVYLKLHLVLVNKSGGPIILARKIKIPAVQVSKTTEDAKASKFVYNPDPYEISTLPQTPLKFGSKPAPDQFATLSPGDKYEVAEWTGVLADLSGSDGDGSSILSGKYVARAVINTWPYPNKPIAATIEAWSRFGRVTNGIITTDFFPVDFPVVRSAPDCRSFRAPSETDGKGKQKKGKKGAA